MLPSFPRVCLPDTDQAQPCSSNVSWCYWSTVKRSRSCLGNNLQMSYIMLLLFYNFSLIFKSALLRGTLTVTGSYILRCIHRQPLSTSISHSRSNWPDSGENCARFLRTAAWRTGPAAVALTLCSYAECLVPAFRRVPAHPLTQHGKQLYMNEASALPCWLEVTVTTYI